MTTFGASFCESPNLQKEELAHADKLPKTFRYRIVLYFKSVRGRVAGEGREPPVTRVTLHKLRPVNCRDFAASPFNFTRCGCAAWHDPTVHRAKEERGCRGGGGETPSSSSHYFAELVNTQHPTAQGDQV